jgi:hypothetical protein
LLVVRSLICSCVIAAGCHALATPPAQFVSAGKIGVGFDQHGDTLLDSYWAADSAGTWHQVLAAPQAARTANANENPGGAIQAGRTSLYAQPPGFALAHMEKTSSASVLLTGTDQGWEVRKEISLRGDCAHVDVFLSATIAEPRVEYVLGSHAFLPDGAALSSYKAPDMVWAPALRKGADQVIGEHFFRAPAVMAQHGKIFAALVPDLQLFAAEHPAQAIIDLDGQSGVADAPLMSFGFCRHRLSGHVTFTHRPGETLRVPRQLHFAYDLVLRADAPEWQHADTGTAANDAAAPQWAFDAVAQKQWEMYGSPELRNILPQTMPYAEYAKLCYPAAFAEKEKEKQLGWWDEPETRFHTTHNDIGLSRRGGVYAGWGYTEGFTSWQAWFNNLRSAYGMCYWGKRLNNQDWLQKSQLMLNMALSAPRKQGAFPTMYNHMTQKWKGCMVSPPNSDSYYCSADMAWKGYWLLRWYQDVQQQDADARSLAKEIGYGQEETLKQCRELAEFFLAHQEASGAIPSWFREDFTTVPVLQESAQTALPAWFLAEMSAVTSETRYLAAARKAGDFLCASAVPQFRYYDFETFFSCSPKECKGGGKDDDAMRDPHTMQLPQNALSMQWSAEALKRLWELTGETKYLRTGIQALDTMIMYQVIWHIPYRTTANAYGGFGAQNSDGEYNDARQAQFACTLCYFGAALHRKDYFERGVAGLRGSFTLINHPSHIANGVYPEPNYPLGLQPENFGHGGRDEHAGRTGFDWGEGSALASAAYILKKYGGAYVDTSAGWAVGIDGVNADFNSGAARIENGLAALPSPYTGAVEVEVKGAGSAKLQVNQQQLGTGATVVPPPAAKPASASRELANNPGWNFENGAMPGWTVSGNFVDMPSRSTRTDFDKSGDWFLGTGEDGEGGWDDSCAGTVLSPRFTTDKAHIKLKVGGGDSGGVWVSLLNAVTNVPLRTARGTKKERMETVTWDVSEFRGQVLRIKIHDEDIGGWGHINVDDIRCED